MLHTYVIFCMVLNPTMCMRYEIVRAESYEPATSQMDCLRGGAIFVMEHAKLNYGGVDYETKGGVRCEAEPPDTGAVAKWVEEEKARIVRTEPQIK